VKRVSVLVKKDIKELLSSRTTWGYLVLLVVLTFPYFDGAKSVLDKLSKDGASVETLSVATRQIIEGMFYSLPLVLIMLVCGVFTAYAVIMDKNKRTIESLLVTPVSLKQVWLAKSLAVAIPGVVIGVGVAVIAVLAIDIAVCAPVSGFVVPGYSPLVSALVIIPILTFLIVMMVIALQLVMTNPRLASLIFTVIFMGVYITTITGITTNWDYRLIYLGIIAVLVFLNYFISRFLTKERIILSSKG